MNSIHENELKCGICIDWFIDPISLPCCGKFICRICLINWFNSEENKNNNLKDCPFCRRDLEYFQVEQAPKATSIAYMVEQEKKKKKEILLILLVYLKKKNLLYGKLNYMY